MLKDQFHSRYNLHNIVAAIHAIREMLADKLWTESEITVITPYRAQAARYRTTLRSLKLYGVKVFTVDAMQGSENQCTIFDTVLAKYRSGGYGHVASGFRLNVALSRSINMFIILIDRKSLDISEFWEKKREAMEEEQLMEDIKRDEEITKHLSKVFNYYKDEQVVKTVQIHLYDEVKYVDMSLAVEFMEKIEKRKRGNLCHNCGEDGHRSSGCTKPRVFKGTCRKCKVEGHRANECAVIFCAKCKGTGHIALSCTGPETRTCRNCNEVGHIKEDCKGPKYRKLRFTLPHEASKDSEIAAAADDVDEPEIAPTPTPLLESWAKLEFKVPDVDPKLLAKYLAGDAESSEEDGGEHSEDDEDEGGEGEFDDGVAIEH